MKSAAHHLAEHVGAREQQRLAVEGMRHRRRQQQAGQHQHEHQRAHRRAIRVHPVGEPAGVHPHPPHREQQEQGLQRADQRQVLDQRVRQLRHREHEHQVEEQLDEGDARVRIARAQQACYVLVIGYFHVGSPERRPVCQNAVRRGWPTFKRGLRLHYESRHATRRVGLRRVKHFGDSGESPASAPGSDPLLSENLTSPPWRAA